MFSMFRMDMTSLNFYRQKKTIGDHQVYASDPTLSRCTSAVAGTYRVGSVRKEAGRSPPEG
jgi:hypothetical protein